MTVKQWIIESIIPFATGITFLAIIFAGSKTFICIIAFWILLIALLVFGPNPVI